MTLSSISNLTGPDSITHKYISSFDIPNNIHNDIRVETFNLLERKSSHDTIKNQIKKLIGQAMRLGQEGLHSRECQYFVDIFILIFYFRDIQCGPGNRNLSYEMFLELWTYFPETCLKCSHLFTYYGGWMDLVKLLHLIREKYSQLENGAFRQSPEYLNLKNIETTLLNICATQMKTDIQNLNKKNELKEQIQKIELSNKKDTFFSNSHQQQLIQLKKELDTISISYWGKWCPSENSQYHWIAENLAEQLYGDQSIFSDNGELICPSLNELQQQSDSKYKLALRHCLKHYRKERVRLNKELNTCENLMSSNNWDLISPGEVSKKCFQNNRDSFFNTNVSQINRLQCTLNFIKYFNSNEMAFQKSGLLGNILKPYLYHQRPLDPKIETYWEETVRSMSTSNYFNNSILVSDFYIQSGTSDNDEVLGLLLMIDQLRENNSEIENSLLYTKEFPHWYSFKKNSSLKEKIEVVQDISLIGDTDFKKVIQFILSDFNFSVNPQIIILSDSDFDIKTWKTIDNILMNSHTSNFKLNIIYWSLYKPLKIKEFTFNYLQIQVIEGFHFYFLEHFLKCTEFPDGYKLIRTIFDSPRYHRIRNICHHSQEGKLSNYEFKNDWINLV